MARLDRSPSAVARAVARLSAETALVDGELVALDETGVSSFPALQAALSAGRDETLHLYLFDLSTWMDGTCGRARCSSASGSGRICDWRGMLRYSDHHAGDAAGMLRGAAGMGLEGIVCKQADAPYRAGRGHGWLKVKCRGREEFVVLGGRRRRAAAPAWVRCISATTIRTGRLHYAGGVGTGFSDENWSG